MEKSLEQKFNNCDEATLVIGQKDLVGGAFIIFGLNVKTTKVICNTSGDEIHKRNWNAQTIADADALSNEYKVSKGGWYFLLSFALFTLFLVGYGAISGIVATNEYNKTYKSKTREEKKELLSKLDAGDLIRSISAVYRIENKEGNELIVRKSSITEDIMNINNPIIEEDYPDTSFVSNEAVKINMVSFLNNTSINTDLEDEYGGEGIVDILDR